MILAQESVEILAEYAGVPVWNGLTNEFHPTQMLADVLYLTWYDARENHPTRSEYRLYYTDSPCIGAASPDDLEAVRRIAETVGSDDGPTVAGLARAARGDIDKAWTAVQHAKRPRIHTFIATSDIHLEYKLRMPREQVLVEESKVLYVKTSLLQLAAEHRADQIVVAIEERRHNFPINQILDYIEALAATRS